MAAGRPSKVAILAVSLFYLLGCSIIGGRSDLQRKEDTLKQELYFMRQAIDQYTMDKNQSSQHLTNLVRAGYLRIVPRDPFTGSSETWRVTTHGVTDVHSGSDRISTEGTPYSSW